MERRSRRSGIRRSALALCLLIGAHLALSPAATASAEEATIRCEAKTARIERAFLSCVRNCRGGDANAACETSCDEKRTAERARLERTSSCSAVAELFEEVGSSESASRLGCRAKDKSYVVSYLGCLTRCENSGSSEDADACSGACGARLSDRQAALREKESCKDMDAPSADVATPKLYAKTSVIWGSPNISVCWINPSSGNEAGRREVQRAVSGTWNAVSDVNFHGWRKCDRKYLIYKRGPVKIRIEDTNDAPHVTALGSDLRKVFRRMSLNFTFKNWKDENGNLAAASCIGDEAPCIRAIAVHEFGHALGFAHEQNRPDTPWNTLVNGAGEPLCEKQGNNGNALIGAWDLSSVMNYCNPSWNNGGQLSPTDIAGAQKYYGASQLMTYERRQDRPGRDYANFEPKRSNPVYCEAACRRDDRCAAYTYVNPGVQGENARCWLKSSAPASRYNPETTSGVKAPVEARTDRPGGDFQNIRMDPNATPEECRKRCIVLQRCRAWTYVDSGVQDPNRPMCWLKDRLMPARGNSKTTSGVIGTSN